MAPQNLSIAQIQILSAEVLVGSIAQGIVVVMEPATHPLILAAVMQDGEELIVLKGIGIPFGEDEELLIILLLFDINSLNFCEYLIKIIHYI